MNNAEPYIYADNAATTPLSPCALNAMMPYLTRSYGNPGGIHRLAKQASADLAALRKRTAACLGCRDRELFFTSGGTESDNWALVGFCRLFAAQHPGAPVRIITSAIEHHAILHTCQALRAHNVQVTYLPVDAQGFVSADDLAGALTSNDQANAAAGVNAPGTALVSIMLANNEVGTIQNVSQLADLAHQYGAPFHTDAVQAVGHIPVNVNELGIDALSLSSHKFCGPHGVGALYVRNGFNLPPLINGGGQEFSKRSGTQNLAGVAGTVAALEESLEGLNETMGRVSSLRDDLTHSVIASTADVIATGPSDPKRRLPSIASFICKNVDAELLVGILDRMGVAAATGSACSAGSTEPSHVVQALGHTDPAWSRGTLRISLANNVTAREIKLLKQRIPAAIDQARLLS